ncbi:MAG: potassium channel family protein [Senegalia sp. (in: firmicutes)]|uniref:potassium channel family protein n=1 Tax=Senegalia sp. (in: firmicutes) TaxID=1924098 RepID=UPI003F96AD49
MKSTKLYKSLIIIISCIIILSLAFYLFELEENSKIDNLTDALWWGFITSTTVGYGDVFPITFFGRIIAILLILIGIGVFGFITASFASIFVEKNFKKGMGLMDVYFKNHIIIIGWNYKSKSIIEELINENNEMKIVIIDNIEQNPYDNKNISYIKGNPWSEVVLKRSNIDYSKTIMILADKTLDDLEMMDAKSILTCLAIRRLNKEIYIISEVVNPENSDNFLELNVDNIIISNQIESKVLVRSILYKSINNTINELITNSSGSELYEITAPEIYINKKFIDISCDFLNKNITLIGINRSGTINLNPEKDTIINAKDILIYISKNKYYNPK